MHAPATGTSPAATATGRGDLMRLFRDRRVDAIFCVRGGYGCTRLLDRLDFAAIRTKPKILLGYSDVTALHCALLKHAGLVSFHGPVLNSDFLREPINDFTMASLWRTLTQARPADDRTVSGASGSSSLPAPRPGRGPVGGRQSVVALRLGGNALAAFLAREDPLLRGCGRSAVSAGSDVDAPARCRRAAWRGGHRHRHQRRLRTIRSVTSSRIPANEDVLRERLAPLHVPTVSGLPFGHQATNATLPVGARAELDARRGKLRILESAVR